MSKFVQAVLYPIAFLLFPWLAEENILVTTLKKGTGKAIMRGKTFERFIMSYNGYHLNDPSKPWPWYDASFPAWEVLHHGEENTNGFAGDDMKDETYDDRPWLLKKLGLYWVGWPWANSVYVYPFQWNVTRTDAEGKEKIFPRAESTEIIYVSDFPYAIVTDDAETKDRLATMELTIVTVAIRNMYRALFSTKDWMRQVTSAINRNVREFVGNHNFQDVVTAKVKAELTGPIMELSKELPEDVGEPLPHGLRGRYGVEIRGADLQTVELSGDQKGRNQEAIAEVYVATQQKAAAILKGQGEAKVIELKGATEAEALEARLKVIDSHGNTGIALAGYDAIQEASKNPGTQTIWANDPLGAIVGVLKPNTTKGGTQP